LDQTVALNSIDTLIILGIAVPSVFMASKIHVPKLRTLSVVLASFLIIHGVYHLIAVLSVFYSTDVLDFLANGIVEPLSYFVLLIFAVLLYSLGR
jgi:hypothetical protein